MRPQCLGFFESSDVGRIGFVFADRDIKAKSKSWQHFEITMAIADWRIFLATLSQHRNHAIYLLSINRSIYQLYRMIDRSAFLTNVNFELSVLHYHLVWIMLTQICLHSDVVLGLYKGNLRHFHTHLKKIS